MSQMKRVSLWAASAAVIAGTGVKNLLFTTLVILGTPATATGFVYEVIQMRHAQLQREAEDRQKGPMKSAPATADAADGNDEPSGHAPPGTTLDEANADPDLEHRVPSMLIVREQFVDTYGGSPEAVPSIYQKVAAAMLAEDDRVFVKLEAERHRHLDSYDRDLKDKAAHLHDLHAQIAKLCPAIVVADTTPVPMDFRK